MIEKLLGVMNKLQCDKAIHHAACGTALYAVLAVASPVAAIVAYTSIERALADNTKVQAASAELSEALILAGQAQGELW